MTTRPPTGPNDPAAGRGADATADVLDAMLNRITQDVGGRAARSGRDRAGQNGQPDPARAVDEDTLAAADAFHRRFAAAEARSPGVFGPSPHLWEQIMQQSPSPALAGQQRQSGGRFLPARTRQPTIPGNPGRLHPGTQSFRVFANATIAVLLILTALGGWRAYDNYRDTGSPPPATSVPGFAMSPATPHDAVAAVETPGPAYACDFSRDIPIFEGVDAPPVDGTVVVLTSSGELVLSCPEAPNPIVMATALESASPSSWPGVVVGHSGNVEDGDWRSLYVNIMNGRSVEVGFPDQIELFGLRDYIQSPWLLMPLTANPSQWAVTDLRTMESRQISEVMGAPWPEGANLFATQGPNGMLALAATTPYGDDLDDWGGAFIQDGEFAGDVLVISNSLDDTHWIDLPSDVPPARDMTLSPDGAHLSLQHHSGEVARKVAVTYTIVRTSDGQEVARSDAGTTDDPNSELAMAWLPDGRAIAFIENSTLKVMAIDGSEVATVFEATDRLDSLRTTTNPNVVTVRAVQAEEVATETPGAVRQVMYSVNVATGESIEFEGWDVRDDFGWEQPPTTWLILASSQTDTTEPLTYRVINPASGEEAGSFEAAMSELLGRPGFGKNSLAVSNDGLTLVVGFGSANLWLLQATDDGPIIRQLPVPGELAGSYNGSVNVVISPSGTMVSIVLVNDESRTRWLLPLDDENAAWIEVPGTAAAGGGDQVMFVPGTGG